METGAGLGEVIPIYPIPTPDYTIISHPRYKPESGQVDWFHKMISNPIPAQS